MDTQFKIMRISYNLRGLIMFVLTITTLQFTFACSKDDVDEQIGEITIIVPPNSDKQGDINNAADSTTTDSIPSETTSPEDNPTDSSTIEDPDTIAADTTNQDTISSDTIEATDSISNSQTDDESDTEIIRYRYRTIGKGIIKPYVKGTSNGCQGMAIYGNYMFQMYKTGYCHVYDISNLDDIKYISGFPLGSYSTYNHANIAQFTNTFVEGTSFPLLAVAPSASNKYFDLALEKVTLEGAELIQSISMRDRSTNNHFIRDWIIGDDGYIWGLGREGTKATPFHKITFYKFQQPDISISNADIYLDERIDYFEDSDDWTEIPNTFQGGLVKNGKLYFLFGTSSVSREIRIYDTRTHQRLTIIDLNKITKQEPEDIDFYGNTLIITLYACDYAIALDLEENGYIPVKERNEEY